jgi:hypothetical protein
MRLKAPITPKARAITSGTPSLPRPYLNGLYASDVHGAAKTLCHDSDLLELVQLLVIQEPGESPESVQTFYLVEGSKQGWTAFVSEYKLQACPDNVDGEHDLKS